jgi:hypothetical protein
MTSETLHNRLHLPPPEYFTRIISVQIYASEPTTVPRTFCVHYVFELRNGARRKVTAIRAHKHGLSALIYDYWNNLPHLARLQFEAFHGGFI